MTFTIADLFLLAVAAFFILSGLYQGFIKTAGSLVGLVGGVVIASLAIDWLSGIINLANHSGWTIVIFIIIMGICSQLIAWVFVLADRVWKIMSIIPFVAGINKLAGGILGFIEAVAVIAAIGYAATTYLSEGGVQEAILGSQVIDWLSIAISTITWVVGIFL
ncbi:CvpA family protein [Candidatus Uhrbacteria bacterium]|jgi:uncharacterized membrane protein required for colicin V production|nr:CvpA family protein [Candidatus Uhrbacteria bacterium]